MAQKTLLLLFIFFTLGMEPAAQNRLNDTERAWLATKPEIVFAGQQSYPPFEFIHPRHGEYSGMAIELIRWIATEFSFNVAFLPMPFANAQKAVETGGADALTGIFQSEERRKRFDFTEEVFTVPASIFARGERTDILEAEDLAGKRVAVQRGDYAIEHLKGRGIQVVFMYTDDFPSALNLVVDGQADALIGDEQIVLYYVFSEGLAGQIKKAASPLYTGSDCMAVAKGNEILLSILDKGLAHAKATGTFNRIYEKWLGTSYSSGTDRLDQWAIPILIGFSLLLLVALSAIAWTLQLKRVVFRKTSELRDLNLELKGSNERLTAANAQLVMDMEERARLEEERRRLEARMIKAQNYETLSLLAGGVAHDFNNLLTTIIGAVDGAMNSGDIRPETYQNLAAAIDTARQAGELARRMLDFSGRTVHAKEPLNLSEMVNSMTKVLETASPQRIPLRFQIDDKELMVRGDPVQLRQVMINLVLNAGEAYEPGNTLARTERLIHIRVGAQDLDSVMAATIKAGHELPPGRYATIEVSDSGKGIEPETMARLFDPFFSTKRKGRGLGLAALAGIVQAHAGAIAVQSVPLRRTTFTVILPLAEQSLTQGRENLADLPGLRIQGTILLVEDQEGVRKTTARMLESLGLRVLQAESGMDAVPWLREEKDSIQGILLGLTLSSPDGKENYKKIRELAGTIPVILTCGGSDEDLQKLPSIGDLAGILKKPYDRPMLVSALLSGFPGLSKIGT